MQITSDTINGKKVIFETISEELPGGFSLDVTRLDYETHNSSVDKRYISAGAPVYYVASTRVAELCKTAVAVDGGSGTSIYVSKNHHFKVGEYLNDGTTGALISAIDTTTSTSYDIITVNTALTYAEDTKYLEGTASGSSTSLKYTPNAMTKDDCFVGEGNGDVALVTIGRVREDSLTYVVPDLYKVALRGGTSGTGKSLLTIE